jgi:peptidoglycan/xylan/chitin deacetylase (PgdA/CDA1 family)
VGRLSGPKNQVILQILRKVAVEVARRVPSVGFEIVGSPVTEEHHHLEQQHPFIWFEGFQKELKPFYEKATVVVGAGRVALEAMALKKPVVAIGEMAYVGPLTPEVIEKAKTTNFGDCFDKEDFNWEQMAKDLIGLLQNASWRERVAETGFQWVQAEYDMKTLYPRMESLYRGVLLEGNLSSRHELPVLMYHRVVDQPPASTRFNLHVTQEDLEKQLLLLKRWGFETITFQDLLTRKVPPKSIILTFDDGYEDNYHYLFPLLQKHQMKAVLYVLGDRKRTHNFWDIPKGEPEAALLKGGQMRKMADSGLVEFGAHSLSHPRLTELSPKEMEREITVAKKDLEEELQKPVISFAYPYGVLNEEIKKTTVEAGYTFGIAVASGPTRFGEDLMEIRRVHMFPRTSTVEYFKKTSGFYLRYRKWVGKA